MSNPLNHSIISLTLALFLGLPMLSSADNTTWSYSGKTAPQSWGSLSPDYTLCSSGKNQSPINIDPDQVLDGTDKGIKFNYGVITPDAIKNTGNGIKVRVKAGTNIVIDKVTFELQGLSIHMPSENTVNSKHFPMEIQFFHENEKGEAAVVSLMYIPGKADRTLKKLIAQMPMNTGESNSLEANTLRNYEKKKKLANYYHFSGSITTPPCTEGVHWFIMKQPLTLSENQHQAFKEAIKQNNNRPVQALNARMITE